MSKVGHADSCKDARLAHPFRLGRGHTLSTSPKEGLASKANFIPPLQIGDSCSRYIRLTSVVIGCTTFQEMSRNICSSSNIPRKRRRLGLTDSMRDRLKRVQGSATESPTRNGANLSNSSFDGCSLVDLNFLCNILSSSPVRNLLKLRRSPRKKKRRRDRKEVGGGAAATREFQS